MLFSFLRILTMVSVFSAKKILTSTHYDFLFIAFVLSHYFLAIIYSRNQISALVKNKTLALRFGGLSAAGLLMFFFNLPSPEVYFGIHHAVSEAYTPAIIYNKEASKRDALFTTLRLFLNSAIAAFILSTSGFLSASLLPLWRVLVFVATLGCVLFSVTNFRTLLRQRGGLDLIVFELLGAIPFIAIKNCPIGYVEMGMYHITFWFFFPIFRNWKSAPRQTSIYTMASIGTTVVLFLMTPATTMGFTATWSSWNHWVQNIAYLHFTTSFALSRASPKWLVRLLQATPSSS